MGQRLAWIALGLATISACTTFGAVDGTPASEDDAGEARPLPPPPPLADGAPALPDGALPPLPRDGGGPDGGPTRDGGGDGGAARRIAAVPLVAPNDSAITNACLRLSLKPFVTKNNQLASAIFAPDNRRITRLYDGVRVAANLSALERAGVEAQVLQADGGVAQGTRVWTGLGPTIGTVGNNCMNWSQTGGVAGTGDYTALGYDSVHKEDKNCETGNTLIVFCLEP